MAGADAEGLRTWWGGPLDVEGLALAAVGAAGAALDRYTGAAGRYTASPELTAAAFDSSGHLRIAGRPLQGFAPLSGFRPTRDGWIRLHANYPHHRQRLLQALDAMTAEEAEAALRSRDSLDAESAIQARGAVAAAVRTRAEWQASDMGRAAAAGPWIVLDPQVQDGPAAGAATQGSGRQDIPQPGGNPRRPLAGVRVLDLTRVIAGPVSTRLMAALGADVLRIDPPVLPELSDQFVDTAFGKRSAVADLGLPETRAALERLVAVADVVITGYRSGSLDRFGLDAASLLSTRPDLVVVTLNSWGTDGPWSRLRGFDSIVQAASGIAHLYGMTDDAGWRPGALPVQALDHATGYGAAAAAVTLLTRRRESGAGGSARLSLARTAEELFGLPPNPRRLQALPAPGYRTLASSYGELRYVRPPLLVEGQPLDYPGPPPPYGSSAMEWVPRGD
ncbi:CoA transferase [Pseudarthrobacter sp. SL88]|uniref:CoA transferase n=1 Tax=Pseudarthrobacter sp. SL88 TaxID=2994666 RepID=UPI002276E3F8|nr:CoA transferase [Pseudarthrobacter sp. SL88]MCY1676157.1 CoA transferase [Pseudarthrobacter sp. SL88]